MVLLIRNYLARKRLIIAYIRLIVVKISGRTGHLLQTCVAYCVVVLQRTR